MKNPADMAAATHSVKSVIDRGFSCSGCCRCCCCFCGCCFFFVVVVITVVVVIVVIIAVVVVLDVFYGRIVKDCQN